MTLQYGPGGWPEASDTVENVNDFVPMWQTLVELLDGRVNYTFADVAARDAELAGLGPSDVRFAWLTGARMLTAWNGSVWVPIAGRRPRATGTLAATVSVGDAAWSGVAWSMTTNDSATFEVSGSSIKVNVPGEVQVSATGLFAASPDGPVYCRITKNGSPVRSNSADQDRVVTVQGSFAVVANDVITVQVFHSSGASRNVGGDASQMAWDIVWLGGS